MSGPGRKLPDPAVAGLVAAARRVATSDTGPDAGAGDDPLSNLAAAFDEGPIPPGGTPVGSDLVDLHALGAQTETDRSVRRIVPWMVSVAAHVAMILLGFIVTWTVVMSQRDEEPTLIIADLSDLMYEPLSKMTRLEVPVAEQLVQDRAVIETPADRLEEPVEIEVEPAELFAGAEQPAAAAPHAETTARPTVTFVGLSTTNARRIVFVIDASGSMIRALPIVLEELKRSLDGLVAEQEFSVIFFSRNQAIVVPPANRLIPGTTAEKRRVLTWIRENVIPAGRSNPVEAIRAALRHEPDVIFMLSENITGSGEFEIDQATLLSLIDRLNPADPRHGRRATRINCVQFLDPDPLDTLRRIAIEHGGEDGYKFLDREELGLRAP
ncbi:MAG: VWA domain-containing protein [Planctomycetes bacterium]|nr:VWA domain-containing protein [Planctomycetota bacterium]